jgi:hypothetical protein
MMETPGPQRDPNKNQYGTDDAFALAKGMAVYAINGQKIDTVEAGGPDGCRKIRGDSASPELGFVRFAGH